MFRKCRNTQPPSPFPPRNEAYFCHTGTKEHLSQREGMRPPKTTHIDPVHARFTKPWQRGRRFTITGGLSGKRRHERVVWVDLHRCRGGICTLAGENVKQFGI